MKKILVLFVLAFGLMSFSSSEYITAISDTEDITNKFEASNDYEISVDYNYSEEIECWICTLTIFNPDFTTTTITGESCISADVACFYARQELLRRME